jgi:hypothetical protein
MSLLMEETQLTYGVKVGGAKEKSIYRKAGWICTRHGLMIDSKGVIYIEGYYSLLLSFLSCFFLSLSTRGMLVNTLLYNKPLNRGPGARAELWTMTDVLFIIDTYEII